MKLLLILSFLILGAFAQDKGYIDMHGGKTDSLSAKGEGFSSNMNLNDNPFVKKADDQHIPIQKIGKLEEEKVMIKKENNE